MMIQLSEAYAIQIENAARRSLEQYGDSWNALNLDQILSQKWSNLEQIQVFDKITVEDILKSERSREFQVLCVQLKVCQLLLETAESGSFGPPKLI